MIERVQGENTRPHSAGDAEAAIHDWLSHDGREGIDRANNRKRLDVALTERESA